MLSHAQQRAQAGFGLTRTCKQSLPHIHARPFRATPNEQQAQENAPEAPTTSTTTTSSSSSSQGNYETPSVPYRFMAALAAAGASETAYLAFTKLTATVTACPTDGCQSVLDSPYASLFNIPLPAYGMVTYAAVAAAAWFAASRVSSGRTIPEPLYTGLAAGCGVLATTSAALMYILNTALGGANCFWCYTSAGLSFTLALTMLLTLDRRHLMDVAGPSLTATASAALALYLGFGSVAQSNAASDFELPYVSPDVTTDSTDKAVELAKKLKAAGAKMYGAFWCTHCYDQKQAFGKAAMADFPYVECYPDGWKRGVKLADACEAASVRAFPTWVINGQVVEGELDLEQVAAQLDAPPPAAVTDGEGGAAAAAVLGQQAAAIP